MTQRAPDSRLNRSQFNCVADAGPGKFPPASRNASRDGGVASFALGDQRRTVVRGVLLWLLGIPIPLIILLYLFHVI